MALLKALLGAQPTRRLHPASPLSHQPRRMLLRRPLLVIQRAQVLRLLFLPINPRTRWSLLVCLPWHPRPSPVLNRPSPRQIPRHHNPPRCPTAATRIQLPLLLSPLFPLKLNQMRSTSMGTLIVVGHSQASSEQPGRFIIWCIETTTRCKTR